MEERGPIAVAVDVDAVLDGDEDARGGHAGGLAGPDGFRHGSRGRPSLQGWRLLVHVSLQLVSIGLITVALATYFMDWHEVRKSRLTGWEGLACAMLPDCHVPPAELPPIASLPTGERVRDTGFDHHGPWLPVLLGVLAVLALVSMRYARWPAGLVTATAALVLYFASWFLLFDLPHLFDSVRSLPASAVFRYVYAAFGLVAVINLAVQLLLRGRARAGR